jgi:hypothetical protein
METFLFVDTFRFQDKGIVMVCPYVRKNRLNLTCVTF